MTPFHFQVDHDGDIEYGELLVEYSTNYTLKWFYPRETEDGISFSDNNEPFILETFETFITDIRNDVNCVYRQNNEDILEYKDNTFRIVPDSSQTGLNFDSRKVEFRIVGHKKELLETLQEMYDWFSKIISKN
jgi:hypothetical protein